MSEETVAGGVKFENEEVQTEKKDRFICHEAAPVKSLVQRMSIIGSKPIFEQEKQAEEDEFYPRPKNIAKTPPMLSGDIDSRPAVMNHFTTIVKQLTAQCHAELLKNGCQRLMPEKPKEKGDMDGKLGDVDRQAISGKQFGKRERDDQPESEKMNRMLSRMKIYRKVFGYMVIYFRAYSPILFHTKKSYEDVLTFRLRQFKEAQHEKRKLHKERVSVQAKMASYRFPDHNRLQKSKKYLYLLLTRIQKQDEVIKFITEILSKMERALSDHYEKERDLEDQIKMLEAELADRRRRSLLPSTKRYEVPNESEDGKNNAVDVKALDDDSEEEPLDPFEEIDEDKRMVLILAYAVCMKDLEEATRKLKLNETKYQGVFPRRELESTKRKIFEEKAQVKFLSEETENLEKELIDFKEQEKQIIVELENFRLMPEEERLEATKKKFAEERGLNADLSDEDEMEEEETEENEFEDETDHFVL